MLILPLMMSLDPETNFENAHQSHEKALAFKRRLYKNQSVQKIIENSLPTFDRLGLLDEMWCKVTYALSFSNTIAIESRRRKLSLFTFNTGNGRLN